jgi:hypothetical protein
MCLLLLGGLAQAQVIQNFEGGIGNIIDMGWAGHAAVFSVAASPSGTGQSLKCAIDGSKDVGATFGFASGAPAATTAQILTYFVYLPADAPDSLNFVLFAQDNSHWSQEQVPTMYAKDIPKGVWYPLNFPLTQTMIKDPSHFDVADHAFGWCGVNIYLPSGSTWAGNVFVDNISLIGVNPTSIADFNDNTVDGYTVNGWGGQKTVLTVVTDPVSGASHGKVLQAAYGPVSSVNPRDDLSKSGVGATTSQALVYWVYLPADTPDSLYLKFELQDSHNWSDANTQIYAKDIPKTTWYPIYADLKATMAQHPTSFDIVDYGFGNFDLEIDSWGLTAANGLNWSGNILIDNVGFLSDVVEKTWVVSDFETPIVFPLENFVIAGTATKSQSNVVDPLSSKNRVLRDVVLFTSAQDTAAIRKDSLLIYNTTSNTYATKITINFLVPTDMPVGAIVSLALSGPATHNTVLNDPASAITISNTNVGKWETVAFNIVTPSDSSWVTLGLINPRTYLSVIAQVTNAAGWKGYIYFDNLTVIGITPIIARLASPVIIVTKENSSSDYASGSPFTAFDYIRFDWEDNNDGTELYNIYVSEKPISSPQDSGVVQIASAIPHGQKTWVYRPWSTTATLKSLYFAVTAQIPNKSETSINSQCQAGPISLTASATAKVKYDKTFASKFTLDGNPTEFASYSNKIITETAIAGSESVSSWTRTSKDFNWQLTMVIDDTCLYVGGNVTDAQMDTLTTQQSWSGDAIEFYMGFYDIRPLSALHPKGSGTAQGDWRIGVDPLGRFALGGGQGGSAIGGAALKVVRANNDSSWTFEAKFRLDSLAAGQKFGPVTNGMKFPFKIDGNKADATGSNRGYMLENGGWGAVTSASLESDWLRPSTIGYLEVTGAPTTSVTQSGSNIPKAFALYNNFPNPFNPSSTIKYDLPQDVKVTLKVYDMLGREVATLVDIKQVAGTHTVEFNAAKFSSGVYFYRITAGNFVQAKKMMLLK